MREGTTRLRLRAIFDSWFPVLVVVVVAIAALGGWATVSAHAAPGTVETTQEETAWSVDGSFGHSAEVQRENPIFPTGTTLTDRSTYFVSVSPELDGTFSARYDGTGDAQGEISMESRLVHRATGEDTVYWTNSTDLTSTDGVTLSPGETETLEFSINASRANDQRENITTALGGSPGELETYVAVDVSASSSGTTGPSSLSYTATLPVTLSDGTYSIGSPTSTSEQVTYTTTETVPREYGPLMTLGGPLVLLVGLIGLAGLGMVRLRDESLALTPEEREFLEYRQQRNEFDEWVVRAELPESIFSRETTTADSFEDIVDFAIDSDVAVIEEPSRGQFYAVTPELLVTYRPPEPLEDASNEPPESADGPSDDPEGAAEDDGGLLGLLAGDDGGSLGFLGGDDEPADSVEREASEPAENIDDQTAESGPSVDDPADEPTESHEDS
jgi:hypothetical protein